jgi:hypothetical protein
VDDVRLFTPEEAKATLPRMKPLLAQLREGFHEYRFARQQAEELHAIHGDSLESRGHPDHGEYKAWRAKEADLGAKVQAVLSQVNALGADVKDPILGLIDFYARRADGEIVLLCYRDDEPDLAWWHPLDSGFLGRRPLDEL